MTVTHQQVRRLALLWSAAALGLLAYALLVESALLAALALLLGTGVNAAREWHAGKQNTAVGWAVMGLGWAVLATGTAPTPVGGTLVVLGGGALLLDSLGRLRSRG